MRLERYMTEGNLIYIDWNKVKHVHEPILEEIETEHDRVTWLTDWRIQKQLGMIQLYEVFNSKVSLKKLSSVPNTFNVGFNVADKKYIFMSSTTGDGEWVVLFMQSGGEPDYNAFTNKGGDSNVGIVISGVFMSIQSLMDAHNVESIRFGTDDIDLKGFYTSLTPYIEKRLSLKFVKKQTVGKNTVFQYRAVK